MELPILGEYDYKLKIIKLMYTKETYKEKGRHRKYLEENSWIYVGCEDAVDDGIFMFYSKREEVSHSVRMTETTNIEKVKFI
ncbi:hypothetical protein BACERE00183_04623 [Bacillus cereus]|nr:hypothetical protein BACERE00183_04623 [Bacillus cereus]